MTHCVDAVYVEDVLRAGYFCDDIGNLLVPSSDAIKVFLEAFKGAREKLRNRWIGRFSNISGLSPITRLRL